MPDMRFALLLAVVIGAAGLSVWVAAAAAQAGSFDRTTLGAVLPLLLLASVAFRALKRRRDK